MVAASFSLRVDIRTQTKVCGYRLIDKRKTIVSLASFFLDKGMRVFKLKGRKNLYKEWRIYAKADLFRARLLYLGRRKTQDNF
jgi:hypothetical protein